MIAGKGGGHQRIYVCDKNNQGCTASVRWVKQVISPWKLTYLDGKHENCGEATSSPSTKGMSDVIESGLKVQAVVTALYRASESEPRGYKRRIACVPHVEAPLVH